MDDFEKLLGPAPSYRLLEKSSPRFKTLSNIECTGSCETKSERHRQMTLWSASCAPSLTATRNLWPWSKKFVKKNGREPLLGNLLWNCRKGDPR